MNKFFVVFGLVAISLFTWVVTNPSSASADMLLDRTGTLIKIDPRILGDDDELEIKIEDSEEENEVESSPSSTSKPESGKENSEQERIREEAKKQAEIARRASDKAKEQLKKQIEINQIKTKTNKVEKESEIEVEGDKLKIKQKIKDVSGKETEMEMQLENGEELQIESKDGDETKKFKLRAREDDQIELEKDGVKVSTKLPISINENNELVVTRPDGTTKVVAIMPDQALKTLRDQNITPDDSVTDVNGDSTDLPELEEEEGESVYKIDGQKEEKVLGLFKVAYKTKAVVSAETGELIRTELSTFDRFMSIFSF
jgi:uncharacterized Rossmann fold enzyme